MYLYVVVSISNDLDSVHRLAHDSVKYEVKPINPNDVLV